MTVAACAYDITLACVSAVPDLVDYRGAYSVQPLKKERIIPDLRDTLLQPCLLL